jgi:hypothetical protein
MIRLFKLRPVLDIGAAETPGRRLVLILKFILYATLLTSLFWYLSYVLTRRRVSRTSFLSRFGEELPVLARIVAGFAVLFSLMGLFAGMSSPTLTTGTNFSCMHMGLLPGMCEPRLDQNHGQ